MNYLTYRRPSYLDQWLAKEFAPKASQSTYQPKVNVVEEEGAFEISLLVPGFEKEELNINLQDNVLMIEAKLNQESGQSNFLRKQGRIGDFTRKFQLPDTLDAEALSANYAAGILTINIPKKEKVLVKKQITVQ